MKRVFLSVLFLMLVSSVVYASDVNVISRATSDGYVSTQNKAVRVINIHYIATTIGDVVIYDGTTQKAKLEHYVSDFGPFTKDVAPIFLNGVYLDFQGITPAEVTIVYQKLE